MKYGGWLPHHVDDMSWEVIESMWIEGKRQEGIEINSSDEVFQIRREWRKYVQGL